MTRKRHYDDPCGIARALEVVGERWGLLVVRELIHGPKRFGALSRGLPGMSQNVLSQRLRELEVSGVVWRRTLGPPASATVYELTERGSELEPVLLALARWGSRVPLQTSAELSADALILALETTFDAVAATGLRGRFELGLGEDRFVARVDEDGFRVARGRAEDANAVLETDVTTLRALVFGGLALADALATDHLRLRGDGGLAGRFVACFPRPGTG